jgi:hypothetical protein
MLDPIEMGMRIEDAPRYKAIKLAEKELVIVIAQFPCNSHG